MKAHAMTGSFRCILAVIFLAVAAAVPLSASPLAPRFPSAMNHQSLNEVAPPTNEADWQFEMTHLDMAIGTDHGVQLRQRGSDIYLLGYCLLTWVLTNWSELDDLRSFCSANGYDYENCFLHYYEDTHVPLGTGGTGDTLIRGWGGGTAAARADARVRCNPWDHEAYVYNPADPGLRAFMRARSQRYMQQGTDGEGYAPDGLMVDTINPRTDAVDLLQEPISGGRVVEFGNRGIHDAAAISWWNQNVSGLIAEANEGMGHNHAVGDRIMLPNIGEYTFTSAVQSYVAAADGALTEFWISEIEPREPQTWDLAASIAAQGKYLVYAQASFRPPSGITSPGNYPSAQDRHQMYALASYWMAKQGTSTYYLQKPPRSGDALFWTPLSRWWAKAREYDIGWPTGPYEVWQQGSDAAGQQYTVYRRSYSRAIILCRPKVGWTYSDYTTPSQTYDLGGEFRLLKPDGTLGSAITSISLAMGEAVVLIGPQPALKRHVCSFTFTPHDPVAGEAVRFEDRSSDQSEIVSRNWDFGDSATSGDAAPSHIYREPGSYNVSLNIAYDDGQAASCSQQVSVGTSAPVAVVPGPYGEPVVDAPIEIYYDGDAISSPDGTLMFSARLTSEQPGGGNARAWAQQVEFSVIDVRGNLAGRFYGNVAEGGGAEEAAARVQVQLPPGVYFVWTDPESRSASDGGVPAVNVIAVGAPSGALWGTACGATGESVSAAVSVWALDTPEPRAEMICILRTADGALRVLTSTSARVLSAENGRVRLSGVCCADGVHGLAFQAIADAGAATFSIVLADGTSATSPLNGGTISTQ